MSCHLYFTTVKQDGVNNMVGKGKFIYIKGKNQDSIFVKDSAFPYNHEEDLAFPLSKFSTDQLFKVKAQIATELENRMDLDEVTEANLEKLKAIIADADTSIIAQLLRQTLDRLEIVSADEKRAKTRQQILEDELKNRMKQAGVSEMKFDKAIQATYRKELVYNVGEDGWDTVYGGIVGSAIEGQRKELSKVVTDTLMDYGLDDGGFGDVLLDALIANVKTKFTAVDAFSIMQKRLTSTTLTELVKQGEALPQGIVSQEISKLKIKRTK